MRVILKQKYDFDDISHTVTVYDKYVPSLCLAGDRNNPTISVINGRLTKFNNISDEFIVSKSSGYYHLIHRMTGIIISRERARDLLEFFDVWVSFYVRRSPHALCESELHKLINVVKRNVVRVSPTKTLEQVASDLHAKYNINPINI